MSVSKLACVSCGAPLQIKTDDDCIQCLHCGVTLQVQHGDGATSLKLAEKVTDAIQDVGKQTQAAIRQEAQATSAEIKKLQAVSELNTLRMQRTSIQTEIRGLEREKKSSQVTNQLQQLRNQEWNLTQNIQHIEKQLAPSGSPNQPAQAASTGAGQGGCLGFISDRRFGGCFAAFVTWMAILMCVVPVLTPLQDLIAISTKQEFVGFTCLASLLAFGIGVAVFLYILNPKSETWPRVKDFFSTKIYAPAKSKPFITLGIMGGLLFGCMALYSIPQGILSNSPEYHATQTVRAWTNTPNPSRGRTGVKAEATEALTLAKQPVENNTTMATEAPEAALDGTSTPTAEPTILDVPSLLGKTSVELDQYLGQGTNPLPLDVNEAPEMPKGGRSLDYTYKGLVFTVFFGQDGKAGGFMLTDGLKEKGYKLNQAEEVLQLFGIHVENEPDGKTIGLVNWENEQGYLLRVVAFGKDQPVWSVQVWSVQ